MASMREGCDAPACASCFDCIFRIFDHVNLVTYCEENERMISDGFGAGNCCICEKFRELDKLKSCNKAAELQDII